ncbi:MAG TPA: redoxin domain-containing protein [Candidatus Nitrosotenuis sp.]|nr:redoxin domain-containing protein [Candidatus Nitrosotenuis sp.]
MWFFRTSANFALVVFALAALSSLLPGLHAQEGDWQQELAQGDRFYAQRKYEDALKSYKRAYALSGEKCVDCLWGQAQSFFHLGAHKNVAETCDRVVAASSANASLAAQALNLKGVALTELSEGKDENKMRTAETALRRALELNPELHIARFNLGHNLLKQKRDVDGVEFLQDYLKRSPNGARAADARSFIENPRRAREPYAPDFSLTTLGGEYLTRDELYGKVVMLDFWFTTCPPCVASIPALQRLVKKFEKDNFMLISISTDGDDSEWRAFIEKNKMNWHHTRDVSRKIINAFEIRGYPTYILLDHEGIVRYRSLGYSPYKDGQVEETIRKWLKARPAVLPERKPFAKAPAPPQPAPPESNNTSERPNIPLTRRPSTEMSGFGPMNLDAPSAQPAPVLQIVTSDLYEWQGRKMVRVFVSIKNWKEFPENLFEPAPDLPPCGSNPNGARTWVAVRTEEGRQILGLCAMRNVNSLVSISFSLPPNVEPGSKILITMYDRRAQQLYRSNSVIIPAPTAP